MRPEMNLYYSLYLQAALFFLIVLISVWEVPRCRALFRSWTPPLLERMLVFCMIACYAAWGVTKSTLPAASDRLGNWLLASAGRLIGDESGVVAESAQAAAVEAYEAETAGIIATVSNSLQAATARLTSLTNALSTNNVSAFYVVLDTPRDFPGYVTNHNLAVTQERMAMTGTNVLSVWFRYSWSVSTSAVITVRCYTATNRYCDLTSVSNTFPNTQTVTHSDGVSVQCYRYDFDASELNLTAAPMAVVPPYEATFGGTDGAPFECPGTGLEVMAHVAGESSATTNVGLTGWVGNWGGDWGTNLQIRCKGGVAVEARWHGTNITGEVSL